MTLSAFAEEALAASPEQSAQPKEAIELRILIFPATGSAIRR
jgi:hypothetical protein